MEKVQALKNNYQAILFPVLDVLLNGGNLLIHLYISWYLSTGDYGILNALFSLLFVLMIFGMSVQTYFAKRVSAPDHSEAELNRTSKVTGQIAGGIFIIMVALSIPMIRLLRSSFIQYGLVLLTFLFQSRLSFYRGLLQGNKAFFKLNISFYAEMITKLLILIPLLRVFKSVEIALASVLAGIIVSYFMTRRDAKPLTSIKSFEVNAFKPESKSESKQDSKQDFALESTSKSSNILKGLFKVFSTQFFFYYFTAAVLILTNYYLGEVSGLYALSTRYGQIFIHVGLSIITVLIPYTSEVKASKEDFRKKVKLLLLIYTGIGLAMLIGYSVIMPIALKLLFGPSYQAAEVLIIPHAVGYFFLSISFYMASMEMISGGHEYIYILSAFSVALVAGLMKWHSSLIQILTFEVSLYVLMAFVLIFRFLTRRERSC